MAIAVFTVSLVFEQAVHAAVLITALSNPRSLRDDLNLSYEVIDVDANGSVDFTFGYDFSSVGFRTELANRFIYVFAPPPNLGGAVASLQPPFVIQTTLDSSTVLWGSSDPVEGYVAAGDFSFATVVQVLSTGSSSRFSGRGAIGIEFVAAGQVPEPSSLFLAFSALTPFMLRRRKIAKPELRESLPNG